MQSLIVAAVILPMIYDKEDLKRAIAAEVQRQTGRELVIGGTLDFSVFPWLAIEVGELSFSNAPGFGEKPAEVEFQDQQAGSHYRLHELTHRRQPVRHCG